MSVIHGTNIEVNKVPSLDLRFADRKSLIDTISGRNLITFSRSSSGTYYDADGVLQSAATNQARFDHDPTTGESLGLLVEESRTNNVIFSETQSNYNLIGTATASTSSTVAPDGTNNTCIRVQGSALNDGISKATSIATSGNHFPTVYARSRTGLSQDVKIAQSGIVGPTITLPSDGSWIRVTGQVSNLGSGNRDIRILQATTNSIDIDVWGFQTELGDFPTSYIPTSGSTVTRAADVAQITGSNFSSWYNQSEGTIYTSSISSRITASAVSLFRTGPTEEISNYGLINQTYFGVYASGAYQANLSTGAITAGQPYKQAGSYKTNDFAVSRNGSTVVTDISGIVPTGITSMNIGVNFGGVFASWGLNGTISHLTYYPQRLQDTTLQKLTE